MISRRRVVQGLGSLGLWPLMPAGAACPAPGPASRFCFEEPPFGLGVASGDPTARSVVIWTRLAAQPLDPGGRGGLGDAVIPVEWAVAGDPAMRDVVASGRMQAGADRGYAVHVDVGGLKPGRHYWYRFAAGGRASRIGRTRTAPEGRVQHLRFAAVSCQDFVAQYGAYADLARERLAFVAHLGDTIYESAFDGQAATDLSSFRLKHALFRGDPLAREAWAAHPFLVTWDDHEVRNNYYGTDPALGALRADGYRAFYEHMPMRLPEGPPTDWSRMRVYRHANFGDLLELDLLDARQYRAVPPGTLLGEAQKQWLFGRLRAADAAWTCIGSPAFIAGPGADPETWDGHAAERAELLARIAEGRAGRAIVNSGNGHRARVSRLTGGDAAAPAVAVEFGVPALSSKAPAAESADPDAGFAPKPGAPWICYEDRGYRGYLLNDVSRDAWTATYRVLPRGDARCTTTLAAFRVNRGSAEPTTVSRFVNPAAC